MYFPDGSWMCPRPRLPVSVRSPSLLLDLSLGTSCRFSYICILYLVRYLTSDIDAIDIYWACTRTRRFCITDVTSRLSLVSVGVNYSHKHWRMGERSRVWVDGREGVLFVVIYIYIYGVSVTRSVVRGDWVNEWRERWRKKEEGVVGMLTRISSDSARVTGWDKRYGNL